MTERKPRYSKEEHARRGQTMYEERVRALVEEGNLGRIVAIDIDSGEFELGDTVLEASERILAKYPDAQTWCVRIGYPAVVRFGVHANVYRATVIWDGQPRAVQVADRQLPGISRYGLYLNQGVAAPVINGDDVVRGHVPGERRRDKTSPRQLSSDNALTSLFVR